MLRERIKKEILKIAPKGLEFSVLRPEREAFGDYSSNVAMILAREIKKNPRDLAEDLKNKLAKSKLFEKIEIAGPGFLNFYLSPEVFIKNIEKVLEEKDNYGRNDALSGKKVIIEYTDPNPFKEFHIGHLMSNSIGESLTRIFEASGAEVRRANYQGDVGLHVAYAVAKMKEDFDVAGGPKGYSEGLSDYELGGKVFSTYAAGVKRAKEDEKFLAMVKNINKKIYDRSDDQVNKLYDFGRKASLEYFEKVYDIIGMKEVEKGKHFDFYFFESEGGPRGKKIVEDGLKKGVFEKSDGAIVFKGKDAGLHTRVFITSEGLPTYEAKELGLAPMKYEKYPYDLSFIVTGNEITDYFRVLMAAMKEMFPDLAAKTRHIPHGMLRFTSGKMSSREGNVITAQSLLDDLQKRALEIMDKNEGLSSGEKQEISDKVAVAAIKYSILRQSIGKDIVFDFDKSLSFEGDSGPYLQYTHARASSVIKKAESAGVSPSLAKPPAEAGQIERILSAFPEEVARAHDNLSPNPITSYLIELAHAFNGFYARERIADAGEESPYRVALTGAVSQVLKNGLWLLGISVPEKM